METLRRIIPLLLAVVAMASCTTTQYVPVIEHRTDTVRENHTVRDSIYVSDSTIIYINGDTVFRDRWHTHFRDRWQHDTLYISKTDSVTVMVPQVKAVEKNLTKGQKGLMTVGAISILALMVFGAFRLGRWWRF